MNGVLRRGRSLGSRLGDDSCHVCTGVYTRLHNEPLILIGCYVYLVVSVVFLINLLVAQCSCADVAIYADGGFRTPQALKEMILAMFAQEAIRACTMNH